MNYYERIQNSIDYIEDNLEVKIDISVVAKEAYMSQANYYRLFFALVGYSVKEYIRLRRISLASKMLKSSDETIVDIAIKFDFGSRDAFTRTFKKITGVLPSDFREGDDTFIFERIDLMEKYFDEGEQSLMEKYPEIKILKELPAIKVAYYNYYGENPEDNAFKVINNWLAKNGENIGESNRIFGYDNPSPSEENQKEYGYEVCVTIDDNYQFSDEKVKTKTLEGGMYVVINIKFSSGKEMGETIMNAWKRFGNWLKESKYTHGDHQWLEEHLHYIENDKQFSSMDLYMPIKRRV